MKTLLRSLAVAAIACTLVAPITSAQQLNTSARGTAGNVRLTNGFEPDPFTAAVTAGGPVDISSLDERCVGHITARASYTLQYRAGEWPLIVSADSSSDTTLVIRAPDGTFRCDDDGGPGVNPRVRISEPRSGRYQIWVGTFSGEQAQATLYISELGTPVLPDFNADATGGSVDLVAGFEPDPYTHDITSGGELDASYIPAEGCVGHIARAPDFTLNWTANSDSPLPLVISVDSASDTTLVINDAGGNWICDDDGGNKDFNPAVTIQGAPSGKYDIWVGSYSDEYAPSTLNISELTAQ